MKLDAYELATIIKLAQTDSYIPAHHVNALLEHIDLLEKENGDLKAQLPQKVELPKEVAEAITELRNDNMYKEDDGFLLWSALQSLDHHESIDGSELKILREYANQNHCLNIANALMYGYTVKEEPTVEDQLRTSWTAKVEKLLADYIGDASPKVAREIIDGIMPLTREVLKAVEAEERE